jgi:hypothetical protein
VDSVSDIAPFLLRNEPEKVVREERMQLDIAQMVLNAADEWVSAQKALVAAQQNSQDIGAEQEAAEDAGARLAVAVIRWRPERGAG